MKLEVCVGNYKEAIAAFKNGGDRIELCDNLQEGGTTPSYGTIKKSVCDIDIPINVIIRPRGGDFNYSDEEFEIMKEDIRICKELGVNGVVFGILNDDNSIDIERNKILKEEAGSLSTTFHMAFDEIEDKNSAIDVLVDLGIDRILTKGGSTNAPNNLDKLKELVEYAGDRIIIMPGGGINCNNREHIYNMTNAKELHGSKIV
ncbi:copper homeostasis protein CutC [Clostridium sardiniense]|uniref:PF03932 family protein CutC n=1 Tax=Clostridium sardiniense TaxID=29369 RepID=A0ABS7L2K4_CLOSR|nr:copper homeostasis protein CutC [Clostridium sardiniense]MBY0757301.1 copper homeostasis protein CutC [Clostridium sardiniense]MDQ0461713.1 copper homeostasis protein [Clostridium sardiniense]